MLDFDQKAFTERLIKIRKEYSAASSKTKFAEALGLSSVHYSRYEKDTFPAISDINRICKLTGKDALWLIRGKNPILKEHTFLEPDLTAPAVEIDGSSVCIIDIHNKSGSKNCTEFISFVEAKAVHQIFPDAFALQVDGDSMSPRINDGDIVIVSPLVRAAEAHSAIICLEDQIGVTCKLFRSSDGEIHLIPANKAYPIQRVRADKMLWALAVLCHVAI